MLVQAAQQEGVGAEQVAQAGQDLTGLGRPDLAGALGPGQAPGPVPPGQRSTLAWVGWATTQRMLVRQPSSLMDRP